MDGDHYLIQQVWIVNCNLWGVGVGKTVLWPRQENQGRDHGWFDAECWAGMLPCLSTHHARLGKALSSHSFSCAFKEGLWSIWPSARKSEGRKCLCCSICQLWFLVCWWVGSRHVHLDKKMPQARPCSSFIKGSFSLSLVSIKYRVSKNKKASCSSQNHI